MSIISQILGERIRYYRKERNFSQEKLSEEANLHATYIGQLERGEKNATIETLYRICLALDVPLVQILEKIDEYRIDEIAATYQGYQNIQDKPDTYFTNTNSNPDNIPLAAYEILAKESRENQKLLYDILLAALKMNKKFK